MKFRRGFACLSTVLAAGALVALAGCAAHHPADPHAGMAPVTGGTGESSPPPVPVGPDATASPASRDSSAGSTAPGGVAISVRFTGATSCRKAADGPLLFDLTIANSSSADDHDIAPLVVAGRYPGGVGPLHVLAATLERQDPAKGTWQEVTMPAGADTPTLQHDWPTVTVTSHSTAVLHYRLTPWPQVGAGTAHLSFYALRESDHRTLDQTTQALCFA